MPTESTHDVDRLLGCTSQQYAQGLSHAEREVALSRYRSFYRHGAADGCRPDPQAISDIQTEDGTRKFLLRHHDGRETESVIIPITGKSGRLRHTLCVSSQVGCAMGCTFCQTATMGRIRQLTTSEIVAQWHHARHQLNAEITNIVFMGMGEPMDNLDAVLPAIDILTDHNAAAIAPSRIGVSTVGHAEGIRRFTSFMQQPGMRQIRLAVSVNAPDQETRVSLMPISKAVPMQALHEAMTDWIQAGGRPILIEYILIPGVTDQPGAAEQLATWIGDLPCRINIIPYNPGIDAPWDAPTESDIDGFIESITQVGLAVSRRATRGRSVMAACGQLSTSSGH